MLISVIFNNIEEKKDVKCRRKANITVTSIKSPYL